MNLRSPLALSFLLAGCGHLGIESFLPPEGDGEEADRVALEGSGGVDGGAETAGMGGRDQPQDNDGLGGASSGEGSGGSSGGPESPCAGDCSRVQKNIVLLYDFDEGSGTIAHDSSPFFPNVDLSIPESSGVQWTETGIRIEEPTLLQSTVPALKLKDAVEQTDEISLEAWVETKYVDQNGPARFFTVSEDITHRNFMIGQHDRRYVARLRTTDVSDNGQADFYTDEPLVTTELTHVVFTHHADGNEYLYVNGEKAGSGFRDGSLTNWDASYHLGVGSEFNIDPNERDWQGVIHLIAVYNRALGSGEVVTNFYAGH